MADQYTNYRTQVQAWKLEGVITHKLFPTLQEVVTRVENNVLFSMHGNVISRTLSVHMKMESRNPQATEMIVLDLFPSLKLLFQLQAYQCGIIQNVPSKCLSFPKMNFSHDSPYLP
jgi:hypothetical protein